MSEQNLIVASEDQVNVIQSKQKKAESLLEMVKQADIEDDEEITSIIKQAVLEKDFMENEDI